MKKIQIAFITLLAFSSIAQAAESLVVQVHSSARVALFHKGMTVPHRGDFYVVLDQERVPGATRISRVTVRSAGEEVLLDRSRAVFRTLDSPVLFDGSFRVELPRDPFNTDTSVELTFQARTCLQPLPECAVLRNVGYAVVSGRELLSMEPSDEFRVARELMGE